MDSIRTGLVCHGCGRAFPVLTQVRAREGRDRFVCDSCWEPRPKSPRIPDRIDDVKVKE